jgi:hypothetical protein
VSPELDAIVARLLAKDPAARPPSARQVAAVLREIAARGRGVSTNAPTPIASDRNDGATEASISAVPTNPMRHVDEPQTVVPPGGFSQAAPTDPSPIHTQNTLADPVGSATTQFETPRVGTSQARVSTGGAPASSALDRTIASAGADAAHSAAPVASGASSFRDRTLRLDEPVAAPGSGIVTRTSVPLPPGGETPPPVESGAPMPEASKRSGLPLWIPLFAIGVVIASLVAIGTWVVMGSRADTAPEIASPAPPPELAEPPAAASEQAVPAPPPPEVKPEPSAEPAPPPKASPPPEAPRAAPAPKVAPKATAEPAAKPAATGTAAAPTQTAAPPPPPPPKKPKLDLPGSGL